MCYLLVCCLISMYCKFSYIFPCYYVLISFPCCSQKTGRTPSASHLYQIFLNRLYFFFFKRIFGLQKNRAENVGLLHTSFCQAHAASVTLSIPWRSSASFISRESALTHAHLPQCSGFIRATLGVRCFRDFYQRIYYYYVIQTNRLPYKCPVLCLIFLLSSLTPPRHWYFPRYIS